MPGAGTLKKVLGHLEKRGPGFLGLSRFLSLLLRVTPEDEPGWYPHTRHPIFHSNCHHKHIPWRWSSELDKLTGQKCAQITTIFD